MNDKISELKDIVFSNKGNEPDIVDTWHHLMINYGYIPFEDFLKMDSYLVNRLLDIIDKMNKDEQKSIPQSGRGKR